MNNPRSLTPAEDNDFRSKFRAKEWIPISARFPSKCRQCGGNVTAGTMVVWNKALSKVMHYNPCAMEWLESQSTSTGTPSTPVTPAVAVSLGGKKAAPVKTEPPPAAPVPTKTAAEQILEEAKRLEEEKKAREEEEARKAEEARKEETAKKIAGMASKEKKPNVNEPRKPGFVRITLKPGGK